MNKTFILLLFFLFSFCNAQTENNIIKNVYNNSPETLNSRVKRANIPLSTITLGVGIGINHLFDNVYDYSLTTGNEHNLKLDELSRNNITVSPIIIVRFSKLEKPDGDNNISLRTSRSNGTNDVKFLDRLSLLLSLDIVKLNSGNVGFNDKIDGGIGFSYALASNLQLGLLYEVKTYRQLREYIVKDYLNQQIPDGNSFYSELDEDNNNLFYNKPINGLSIKLIFNINTLKF